MGLQAIPNDEEFAAAEMAAEIFEKGDEFGGADGAVDELEVDIPEGDARHGGELVPCEAVLQDRRCGSRYSVYQGSIGSPWRARPD